MGFCIFDNVAVAARTRRPSSGIERIAIVDWDVHHGNGTQALVGDDPSVLFVSLHQWPFYPGSGGPDDQGETPERAAAGRLGRPRVPARRSPSFEPRSARSTPSCCSSPPASTRRSRDPLGEMDVTADGFRELARRCAALAPRLAAVLEGGYDVQTLPELESEALEGFGSRCVTATDVRRHEHVEARWRAWMARSSVDDTSFLRRAVQTNPDERGMRCALALLRPRVADGVRAGRELAPDGPDAFGRPF